MECLAQKTETTVSSEDVQHEEAELVAFPQEDFSQRAKKAEEEVAEIWRKYNLTPCTPVLRNVMYVCDGHLTNTEINKCLRDPGSYRIIHLK